MKKITFASILLLFFATFSYGQELWADRLFTGNHELINIGSLTILEKSTNYNSCFVISKNKVGFATISFIWKSTRKENILLELPLNKLRIIFDNTIEKPYIKFAWVNNHHQSEGIEASILYVVLVCKESLWNPSVVLPKVELEKLN